ncbi:hypothetical protein ACJMK2_028586 [Sinanodonta woodiana]|uniref:Uncharacterized protein n=1 Tax=Sinanodonta woodiana TaxID=1069815 RepID=A0ABD3X9I5_SINWO
MSSHLMNPDEDFILHGQSTSFWEKPVYLNNSQLTTTTDRLCQHTLFNPTNYKDKYTRSISSLDSLSKDQKNSLNRSVTFSDDHHHDKYSVSTYGQQKLLDGPTRRNHNEVLYRPYNEDQNGLDSKPWSPHKSDWYVRPKHLLSTKEYPSLESAGMSRWAGKSHNRSTGTIGAAIASEIEQKGKVYDSDEDLRLSMTYFPVTLGASYELEPFGKLTQSTALLEQTRRSKSAKTWRSEKFDSSKDMNKLFFRTAEAPKTGSASVLMTSPYVSKLAKLRMEKLRIEEDLLLEAKRLEELERIRGPRPSWYESTGPDFHYEAHKNTELLKLQNNWQDLMDYREDLLRSSRDLAHTYEGKDHKEILDAY